MTSHLKAYGGSGHYGGERVGRVLKNIIFSGKGLTKKPANPDSRILPGPNKVEAAIASCFAGTSEPERIVPSTKFERDVLAFFSK
jgi:hypothetical protein